MKHTIRTFIAIKILPENELLDIWTRLKEELNNDTIKWVDRENLHITLRFLGETTHKQIDEIKISLMEMVQNFECFNFNLEGLSFFKNGRNPKVIFVNTAETPSLNKLANSIYQVVANAGFKKEKKNYQPHLTVARIKHIKNKTLFYTVLDKYRESIMQEVLVSEIIFYESILQTTGSIYKPLQIFKLKKI